MSWILYIILGNSMPTLLQINRYATEISCRSAITELASQGVRSVCLFKQDSNLSELQAKVAKKKNRMKYRLIGFLLILWKIDEKN